MKSNQINNIASNLLVWYDNNLRKYSWRKTNDPYKIWLSEIMLQQTQAITANIYYEKWIKKFPTLSSVANSNLDDILKQWEGLGYYARARNFYSACQIVHNNNKMPNTYDSFISLPGVGPYTAGAVMSIAFNQCIPAIDVNVFRIFSRMFKIDISKIKGKKKVYKLINLYIDKNRPGDFNQALMDLGRYVCSAKIPKCEICPINSNCKSFTTNTVLIYPKPNNRKKKPHFSVGVGIIKNKNLILVSKRKNNKMLGGLWEFPGGKVLKNETIIECIKREIMEELGISVNPSKFIKTHGRNRGTNKSSMGYQLSNQIINGAQ